MDKFNWKNIFKSWAGVPILILLAALVVWVVYSFAPAVVNKIEAWQAQRAYEKIFEPYYKDTYGGRTPEETYDMFIGALKNGNIELASKYFVYENQDDWKETLYQYKQSGVLAKFVSELEGNRKSWKLGDNSDEQITFLYKYTRSEPTVTELPVEDGKTQKVTLPAGTFNAEVIFTKHPTGIWKIESL